MQRGAVTSGMMLASNQIKQVGADSPGVARVLAGHAPGASACRTAGRRSDANAIYSVHARSTGFPHLDDHIVWRL